MQDKPALVASTNRLFSISYRQAVPALWRNRTNAAIWAIAFVFESKEQDFWQMEMSSTLIR